MTLSNSGRKWSNDLYCPKSAYTGNLQNDTPPKEFPDIDELIFTAILGSDFFETEEKYDQLLLRENLIVGKEEQYKLLLQKTRQKSVKYKEANSEADQDHTKNEYVKINNSSQEDRGELVYTPSKEENDDMYGFANTVHGECVEELLNYNCQGDKTGRQVIEEKKTDDLHVDEEVTGRSQNTEYIKPTDENLPSLIASQKQLDTVDGTETIDETDTIDATAAIDGTDTIDVTAAIDGMDTIDGTAAINGTDTIDGTDTTDRTDTVDGTDTIDGTCTTDETDNCKHVHIEFKEICTDALTPSEYQSKVSLPQNSIKYSDLYPTIEVQIKEKNKQTFDAISKLRFNEYPMQEQQNGVEECLSVNDGLTDSKDHVTFVEANTVDHEDIKVAKLIRQEIHETNYPDTVNLTLKDREYDAEEMSDNWSIIPLNYISELDYIMFLSKTVLSKNIDHSYSDSIEDTDHLFSNSMENIDYLCSDSMEIINLHTITTQMVNNYNDVMNELSAIVYNSKMSRRQLVDVRNVKNDENLNNNELLTNKQSDNDNKVNNITIEYNVSLETFNCNRSDKITNTDNNNNDCTDSFKTVKLIKTVNNCENLDLLLVEKSTQTQNDSEGERLSPYLHYDINDNNNDMFNTNIGFVSFISYEEDQPMEFRKTITTEEVIDGKGNASSVECFSGNNQMLSIILEEEENDSIFSDVSLISDSEGDSAVVPDSLSDEEVDEGNDIIELFTEAAQLYSSEAETQYTINDEETEDVSSSNSPLIDLDEKEMELGTTSNKIGEDNQNNQGLSKPSSLQNQTEHGQSNFIHKEEVIKDKEEEDLSVEIQTIDSALAFLPEEIIISDKEILPIPQSQEERREAAGVEENISQDGKKVSVEEDLFLSDTSHMNESECAIDVIMLDHLPDEKGEEGNTMELYTEINEICSSEVGIQYNIEVEKHNTQKLAENDNTSKSSLIDPKQIENDIVSKVAENILLHSNELILHTNPTAQDVLYALDNKDIQMTETKDVLCLRQDSTSPTKENMTINSNPESNSIEQEHLSNDLYNHSESIMYLQEITYVQDKEAEEEEDEKINEGDNYLHFRRLNSYPPLTYSEIVEVSHEIETKVSKEDKEDKDGVFKFQLLRMKLKRLTETYDSKNIIILQNENRTDKHIENICDKPSDVHLNNDDVENICDKPADEQLNKEYVENICNKGNIESLETPNVGNTSLAVSNTENSALVNSEANKQEKLLHRDKELIEPYSKDSTETVKSNTVFRSDIEIIVNAPEVKTEVTIKHRSILDEYEICDKIEIIEYEITEYGQDFIVVGNGTLNLKTLSSESEPVIMTIKVSKNAVDSRNTNSSHDKKIEQDVLTFLNRNENLKQRLLKDVKTVLTLPANKLKYLNIPNYSQHVSTGRFVECDIGNY